MFGGFQASRRVLDTGLRLREEEKFNASIHQLDMACSSHDSDVNDTMIDYHRESLKPLLQQTSAIALNHPRISSFSSTIQSSRASTQPSEIRQSAPLIEPRRAHHKVATNRPLLEHDITSRAVMRVLRKTSSNQRSLTRPRPVIPVLEPVPKPMPVRKKAGMVLLEHDLTGRVIMRAYRIASTLLACLILFTSLFASLHLLES